MPTGPRKRGPMTGSASNPESPDSGLDPAGPGVTIGPDSVDIFAFEHRPWIAATRHPDHGAADLLGRGHVFCRTASTLSALGASRHSRSTPCPTIPVAPNRMTFIP